MALKQDNLNDSYGLGRGITPNFEIWYDDSLPNQTRVIANANALIAAVETEFTVTTGWFNTPAGKFGASHRQRVLLNRGGGSGANNSGYGNDINLDSLGTGGATAAVAAEQVKMVWMNEWVEILMSLTNGKWNAGDSSGEALSQYCGIVRFQQGHYAYYGSWVAAWLNTAGRPDWVTSTEGTDGNAVSFGCALAFLYYLNTQLGFSIDEIIAAYDTNLMKTYNALTGDPGNPFPFFASLLERAYPSSSTASIPGPVSDDPFPIAALSFLADKNTFGKDEVQDIITTSAGRWPRAFWLAVDGFSQASYQSLGIAPAPLAGQFASMAGVTLAQRPDIDYENATHPRQPQRIRIPYDVTFSSAALAGFPSSGSETKELDGSVAAGGTTVPGGQASMLFELVAGSDPYFTNIDPSQNNVFYLSQDVRVFTATPDLNGTPVPGGPAFTSPTPAGAYGYVQSLLGWLNTTYSDPTGTDPFTSVLPGQGGSLTGDSSVTPFTVDWSHFPPRLAQNFNFAIARVRLRGTAGPSGAANGTKVFFRLWSTSTADTDYQPTTTYLSDNDTAGQPGRPRAGAGHTTLPFFATGNNGAAADYAAGGPNNKDVTIATGDSVWVYYGCFLNVYDGGNVVDGRPVQQWLNGTHHCLVAQIAYDDTPLFTGESPQSSDKLAQRNLQVTLSDNPGPADTHRVPQTFDLRPSALDPTGTARPDELMIDWGRVPTGSTAHIFWPAVQAQEVLDLADALYATHTLKVVDANTIACEVTGGVSYVPIPARTGDNFAGLFTVDLPVGIHAGEEYSIVVRRLTDKQAPPPVEIRTLPANVDGKGKGKAGKGQVTAAELESAKRPGGDGRKRPPGGWRVVTGTFQVTIPVSTPDHMLFAEENTLAILRWRLLNRPLTDRWVPVLKRLVEYVAARVDGLGGDSSSIEPSPNGVPVSLALGDRDHGHEHGRAVRGKVSEVRYDCNGAFEGFVLDACACGCEKGHVVRSCSRGIARIVLRALRHDLTVTIVLAHEGGHVERISVE